MGVIAQTNKNEWLADRMRRSLFEREIPTFESIGTQAHAESSSVGVDAVVQMIDEATHCTSLDHQQVALTQLRMFRDRQDAMIMTVGFMKMLENFKHRHEDAKVANAIHDSRQRLLKLGILSVQHSQRLKDLKMRGATRVRKWIMAIYRHQKLLELVCIWRSQCFEGQMEQIMDLTNELQLEQQDKEALQAKLTASELELKIQGDLGKAKVENEKRIAELEADLNELRLSSNVGIEQATIQATVAGKRSAGVRHLDWVMHNWERFGIQPKSVGALLATWQVQARLEKMMGRSIKELKSQAAKSISKLKTESKIAKSKADELLGMSKQTAAMLKESINKVSCSVNVCEQ